MTIITYGVQHDRDAHGRIRYYPMYNGMTILGKTYKSERPARLYANKYALALAEHYRNVEVRGHVTLPQANFSGSSCGLDRLYHPGEY